MKGPVVATPRIDLPRWPIIRWSLGVPLVVILSIGLLAGQMWTSAPLFPLLFVIMPWFVARHVFIPLGMPRAAYFVSLIASWTWHLDRVGGAALAGTWALCRRSKPDDKAASWILDNLNRSDPTAGFMAAPLRGAGVVAMAMLAAYRNDLDGARTLFASVSTIDDRACPQEARTIASRWLAAEAASRGDWQQVVVYATSTRDRELWLLGGIAARLLNPGVAPSNVELWLRWLIAPHRSATLPLVRRALASAKNPPPDPDDPRVRAANVSDTDLVGRAVMLHTSIILRRPKSISGDDLRRLGGAWDAMLDDECCQSELKQRALIIGASGTQAVIEPLRRAIDEDMAIIIRAANVPHDQWNDLGETIARVRRLLRDQLLSEIELACQLLRRRVDDNRQLPPVDEWQEWTTLRNRYEQAASLIGVEFRRLAFPTFNSDICHFAVWLFNERKQRSMANAMFRFMLVEAEALDDDRTVTLQRKNVECGV